MSNNLHNDHFTSTRSHQTLVMISWAHLSEEVASLYNFLSVCLWIQFSSDDQIGWRASSQDVEQQWSVYLRYVCVSAEQCQCSSSSEASSITKQPRSIFLPLSWSPATDQPPQHRRALSWGSWVHLIQLPATCQCYTAADMMITDSSTAHEYPGTNELQWPLCYNWSGGQQPHHTGLWGVDVVAFPFRKY